MRKTHKQILVLLILVFLAFFISAVDQANLPTPPTPYIEVISDEPDPPEPASASLRGTVRDKVTDHLIVEARVTILPHGVSATTDKTGSFHFPPIPVNFPYDLVTIVVEASGYGQLRIVDDRLYGGHSASLDATLEKGSATVTVPPPLVEN
ncbi:MAG TPA: carboxypeptidase-like regulatory domain-containing protein [Candidatus Paceibacterota bacterium]